MPAGAAIDQPEARVRAVIVIFAERKAALAVIGEGADIGLQFGAVRKRRDKTHGQPGLLIVRRAIDRAALAFDDRNETVAAGIIGRNGQLPLAQLPAEQQIGIDAVAAAVGGADFGQVADIVAEQLDGAGNRALAFRSAAAAARDPRALQGKRVVAGPCHPAAERIGLRHAVEDQQRAGRGIAAEAAQGDALAGRIGRPRVRAAELLQPGNVAQYILDGLWRF